MKYDIDFIATAGHYSTLGNAKVEADNIDEARRIATAKARSEFRKSHPRVELEPEIEMEITKNETIKQSKL